MWTKYALLIVGFLLWPIMALADAKTYEVDLVNKTDEIYVFVNHLPFRATGESGRQYDLLMDELFAKSSFRVSRVVAPLSRAGTLFKARKKSCLFPTGSSRLDNPETAHHYVGSKAVDYFSLRLYAPRQSTEEFYFLESLRNRNIGYIAGSGAIRTLGDVAAGWTPVESESQLVAMIKLGRLDGFVGHYPDTQIAIEKLDAAHLVNVKPLLYGKAPETAIFLCHANEVGAKFIAEMNELLDGLRRQGRLKEILGQFAILATPNPHL
ncbi:hypothetical protein [Roseibium sp.]|uniref:hypothetical protein n=1 Tax=Roseibium sp. TaxID=1936156 RepID=UPI003BAE71ED